MRNDIRSSLLAFYSDKELNLLKVEENKFRLPDETLSSIRFTTFIEFSSNILITLSIDNREYSGISKKLLQNIQIQNLVYNKRGNFTFDVAVGPLAQVLADISATSMKLIQALKTGSFLQELDKNRLRAKSFFPQSNFFHSIDKKSYTEIYQIEDCIWLGDISLFIYHSSDCTAVRCFLEYKHSKKLKFIKTQEFRENFNDLESLIKGLDFQYHSTLRITKDLYCFFLPPTSHWVDFDVAFQRTLQNDKMFKLKPASSNFTKNIRISNEASENPEKFLELLQKSAHSNPASILVGDD